MSVCVRLYLSACICICLFVTLKILFSGDLTGKELCNMAGNRYTYKLYTVVRLTTYETGTSAQSVDCKIIQDNVNVCMVGHCVLLLCKYRSRQKKQG